MSRRARSTIKPGLDNASFFARVPLARGLLGESFAKRHPYLAAHEAFVAGMITREQAVEHILTDREFMAAADMDYLTGRSALSPRAAAQRVVSHIWALEAVKAAQARKAAQCAAGGAACAA